MDQIKKTASLPRTGINRSTDTRNLQENDTTYVLNGNIESIEGDFVDYSWEKSNIKAVKFPEGYKVIGRVNRRLKNYTYYFLTNPSTKKSIFGYVDNSITYNEENVKDIGDELPIPLEEQEQEPYNTFHTLIDDRCSDYGFNFNIDFPIHNPLIKEEKTGGELYFTDFNSPSRYIKLDDIEYYFTQEVPCQDDIETQCADFEKMRIHKQYLLPEIEDVVVAQGGVLKKGSYTFVIALCDSNGSEVSEYVSITQPISIWENTENTGKAIKLKVSNLDEDYTHYKIACITPVPVEVGVYPTTISEVTISDLSQSRRIDIQQLSYVNTRVLKSKGLSNIQNSLAEYGLVFEEEINLQPIVNLMGSFLEWQTHVAREDLYSHGDMRSKFLGINRNEVVPYGIRFLMEGGSTTSVFPLVAREANAFDRQIISENNRDRKSFTDPTLCDQGNREQRWQYYNTASVTGSCETELDGVEVTDTYTKVCTVMDTGNTGPGSFMLSPSDTFSNLVDYIEDNIEECSNKLSETNVCEVLNQNYDASCDVGSEEDCSLPQKVGELNFISSIEGENVETIIGTYDPFLKEVSDPEEVPPRPSYTFADGDSFNSNGVVFKNRSGSITYPYDGSRQSSAIEIPFGFSAMQGRTARASVTNSREANGTGANERTIIFRQGMPDQYAMTWGYAFREPHFYKTKVTDPISINLLMDKRPDRNSEGVIQPAPQEYIENDTVRISIGKLSTSDSIPQWSSISIYTDNIGNRKILCKREGETVIVEVVEEDGTLVETATIQNITVDEYIAVVVDFALVNILSLGPTYSFNISPRASFFIYKENLQEIGKRISWDNIKVSTTVKYETTCTYIEPVIKSCETSKYKRGEFGYWESEILYPDNQELFDSSKLLINSENIPTQYRSKFSNKFSQSGNSEGTYRVKDSFNLACKPIRHFKFPDNKVSPFMSHSRIAEFGESYIYPLGVTIDENYINILLDIALDNKLIDKEQRKAIYGYEIFRGNLTTDRTVVSSGLLYDMREYEENGKKVKYSNYPYNSYSEDKLNLGSNKPTGFGQRGSQFTYHTPEVEYTNNVVGTEISIEGYQFGYSKGWFDEVKDHPKMVILSSRAQSMAETLATTEVIAESIIATNNAITNVGPLWTFGGPAGAGTNIQGWTPAMAAAVLVGVTVGLEGYFHRYATYKYQWLETFKNLGSQTNFANYYFSEGNYNYMLPEQTEGDKVRNLRIFKNIKDGRFVLTDTINKEKIEVNNIDREYSVFLKVDDINYPSVYSSYDSESLTYLSENGFDNKGRSPQINKKIASPYIQVVNRNPAVHGTLESVNWISTSYKGDLRFPQSTCLPIFGGDTFISRHTLKRKIPLFLTTTMGQANMTPFDYKFYSNIGTKPRFYVNFDVNSEFSNKGKTFPQLTSEYEFDNSTSRGFYITSPSKFYLYYYGVPSFLTETRINTNFREYGVEPKDNFYPNVGDVGWWTQETNVPLRTPNFYKYDQQFSNQTNSFNYRKLPSNFKRRNQDIIERATNGVILSLQDNDENGQLNPWLKFRPLDFHEFESKYGELVELKTVENEAVLARFSDTSILYNKVSSTVDDGSQPSAYLGGKEVFQRRTTSFINSELGYGGTNHKESLSCEFGHFYVDNKRGQVIQVPPGGGSMIEISNVNSFGKPTNMKDWFKRNLPYRILESGIEGVEEFTPDNSFNTVGTTFGYDSLHKRILITKKDYLPVNDCVAYKRGVGFYDKCATDERVECPEGYTYNPETQVCERVERTPACPEGYMYNQELNACVEQCVDRILFLVDGSKNTNVERVRYSAIAIKERYPNKIFRWSLLTFGTEGFEDQVIDEPNIDIFLEAVQEIATQVRGTDVIDLGSRLCDAVSLLETPISNLNENTYIAVYSTGKIALETQEVCNITGQPSHDIFATSDYFKSRGGKISLQLFEYDEDYLSEFENIVLFGQVPFPSEGFGQYGYAYSADNNIEPESVYTIIGGISDCVGEVVPNNCGQVEVFKKTHIIYIMENRVDVNHPVNVGILNHFSKMRLHPNFEHTIYTVVKFNNDVVTTLSLASHEDVSEIINAINTPIPQVGAEDDAESYDIIKTTCYLSDLYFSQEDRYFSNVVYSSHSKLLSDRPRPCFPTQPYNHMKQRVETVRGSIGTLQRYTYIRTMGESDVDFGIPRSFNDFSDSSSEGIGGKSIYDMNSISVGDVRFYSEIIDGETNCTIVEDYCECIETADPTYTNDYLVVDIDDTNYFKEVSWTIAYNPQFGQFSSFMDYLPNYYVNIDRAFITGDRRTETIWSHNVTNKSFGVFYGKKFNFEIETIAKAPLGSYLGSVELLTEARRFWDNQDYYINPNLTFNKSLIYNREECSGELTLDLVKGSIAKYPITISETEQRIPITQRENTFTYNYFFDRKIKGVMKPFLRNDINQIKIDVDNVSFKQKGQLPRLNGEYFQNRLTYNTDSRFCMVLKLNVNLINLDNL